jgi:hypothetical protein
MFVRMSNHADNLLSKACRDLVRASRALVDAEERVKAFEKCRNRSKPILRIINTDNPKPEGAKHET